MTSVSVITLAKGRSDHLVNVVRGLSQQMVLPTELIVAVMQDALYTLPDAPFPIRQMQIEADALPLAMARNVAAGAARGETLVFLDMDCIPTPDLVADYAGFADTFDGLLMGEVLYLPGGATAGDWSYDSFAAVAEKHSDRRGPACRRAGAVRRLSLLLVAQFRDAPRDLPAHRRVRRTLCRLWRRGYRLRKDAGPRPCADRVDQGGLAYHQYHPHHMPPVHHLDSVVRNAQLFEAKWGYRTMGHWLHAFRLMGLIDDAPGRPIRILRAPDDGDRALTGQQSHQPYANTARVLRQLEAAARAPDTVAA